MPGDVAALTEAFEQYTITMSQTQTSFGQAMSNVATQASAPAAAGSLTESAAFLKAEQQSRAALTQFMSKVDQGLAGYGNAIGAIGQLYANLIQVNVSTMSALLKQNPEPVPTSPVFTQDALIPPAGG